VKKGNKMTNLPSKKKGAEINAPRRVEESNGGEGRKINFEPKSKVIVISLRDLTKDDNKD
jgi:hypothetical protein